MPHRQQSQGMEHNSPAATIYALVAICSWSMSAFLNIGVGDIQAVVSILGGLAAFISGSISIYKQVFKKPN